MADLWTQGDPYERYMGRWSRPVAAGFLGWLAMAPEARWLDVGCGTGALASTVLAVAAPHSVVGIDPSPGFVATARSRTTSPRAEFTVGHAMALPVPDDAVDVTVSGLVLNFVPQVDVAVAEMSRVTRPDGWVAAYVWDYDAGMQMLRYFWNAALVESAAAADEVQRFPICAPEPLRAAWLTAGLTQVETGRVETRRRLTDFDDYWAPFLAGQGPAPGYLMSLPPERRELIEAELRGTLPIAGDGSIELMASAWTVRGRVPG
jgi:SAM-dependent methyltransferase